MALPLSNSARSFSADVLSRILTILHQEGAIKKTNLAGKARLNYLTCVKYLELLKSLGLVQSMNDLDDGAERFSVTEAGLRFNRNLKTFLQKDKIPNAAEYHHFNNENNVSEFIQNEISNTVMENEGYMDENGEKVQGKIMLVDDEKDILFTYKLFLSEEGFEADVFADSTEALRHIAMSPEAYQLVITDIRMSSLNGLQLYHGIRALNSGIKVIFLSALDATDELVSVLPGIKKEFILKKPVNRELFSRAVAIAMQPGGKKLSAVN